ncbi:uncharacterized protein B0T15DRAFT_6553 [Chaetomium strumarium]|uniref:Uncharacterized protein n=1 Tax=Chaetomium strumarium TaxID=1170767 RepID=A0AAJ0M585_9PEZI|nr:hypothetical protein B0T15DRAFT_6553 [Chaetomium strumarium]
MGQRWCCVEGKERSRRWSLCFLFLRLDLAMFMVVYCLLVLRDFRTHGDVLAGGWSAVALVLFELMRCIVVMGFCPGYTVAFGFSLSTSGMQQYKSMRFRFLSSLLSVTCGGRFSLRSV